jgi:hypothetical protein
MLSRELQKGVATCCWRISVMIVFTALQLMFRSSSGDAKAAAASAARIDRYILEVNEGDADLVGSNGDSRRIFIRLEETPQPRACRQLHGEHVCSTSVKSAWALDWHFRLCRTLFGLPETRGRRSW